MVSLSAEESFVNGNHCKYAFCEPALSEKYILQTLFQVSYEIPNNHTPPLKIRTGMSKTLICPRHDTIYGVYTSSKSLYVAYCFHKTRVLLIPKSVQKQTLNMTA